MEKNFAGGSQTAKFVNVFSLESFPLYGIGYKIHKYNNIIHVSSFIFTVIVMFVTHHILTWVSWASLSFTLILRRWISRSICLIRSAPPPWLLWLLALGETDLTSDEGVELRPMGVEPRPVGGGWLEWKGLTLEFTYVGCAGNLPLGCIKLYACGVHGASLRVWMLWSLISLNRWKSLLITGH